VVLLAVPLRVQARILEPEVGREIDDVLDLAPQLRHQLLRFTVGRPRNTTSSPSAAAASVGSKRRSPYAGRKAGVQVGDALSRLGVGRGQLEGQLGVASDDPQQFCTRVAGCSDDSDP
jgi:hypothetical protein